MRDHPFVFVFFIGAVCATILVVLLALSTINFSILNPSLVLCFFMMFLILSLALLLVASFTFKFFINYFRDFGELLIGAFNVQVFGQSKSKNDEVVQVLLKVS